jgi:hypothetical protein
MMGQNMDSEEDQVSPIKMMTNYLATLFIFGKMSFPIFGKKCQLS